MPDYSKAKIYKIECNITNEVYYGSTVKNLCDRITCHRCKRDCSAINIIDRGNYTYKVIEEYSCDSKFELETRERWWIENNVCVNKNIPTRTKAEHRQDNREHISQYNKDYWEKNKKKRQQIGSRKIKCECGGKYTHEHKQVHCRTKKHQDYLITLT